MRAEGTVRISVHRAETAAANYELNKQTVMNAAELYYGDILDAVLRWDERLDPSWHICEYKNWWAKLRDKKTLILSEGDAKEHLDKRVFTERMSWEPLIGCAICAAPESIVPKYFLKHYKYYLSGKLNEPNPYHRAFKNRLLDLAEAARMHADDTQRVEAITVDSALANFVIANTHKIDEGDL